MKTSKLINIGSEILKKNKIASHILDSEIILSKILNTSREKLLINQSIVNSKRPLGAISLRVPKALPPGIDKKRMDSNELDEWPDDQSFKLNKWERKYNLIKENQQALNDSFQNERSTRRRNIPRSSRRKY